MEHNEKQLRNIERALDRIADAIEHLASKIEQVTGREDRGKGFLRTLDIGRE
jgi:predicted ATPase